jgi:hypothetical protein
MLWFGKRREEQRRRITEASEDFGRAQPTCGTLLGELKEAVLKLGHEDGVQFMFTTRGPDEAKAVAEMVVRVAKGPGGFRNAIEASEIADALILIIWAEMDTAAKQLGHESNFEMLRAAKGDETAVRMVQWIGEAGIRHEART